MALALEIEYLAGVCFAAVGPESDAADWPPQPDRIFSALVATWGAHGEPEDERLALAWLEGQPPPRCEATAASHRTAPVAFVPPNDARVDRAKNATAVMPLLRNRQPRRFPAARPQRPVVRHFWPQAPDAQTFEALGRLARDTAYIGHSASLTRCHFALTDPPPVVSLTSARRSVYPGRLEELRAAHARFVAAADRKDRPGPGAPLLPPPAEATMRTNTFAARWLVLEHVGGRMPDLRAAAVVSRGIRKALMSGYGQLGDMIPAVLSGHEPDGSPARVPHLAIVPLAFTGFTHADGRVLGFALVPPTGHDLLDDETFLRVLRKLAARDPRSGRRVIEVTSNSGTAAGTAFSVALSPSFELDAGRRSLEPAPYIAPARIFATVTPIVLDRHLKRQGAGREEEIAGQIAAACHRNGLPAPQQVVAAKHSAIEGVPSSWPSGNGPAWLAWRLTPSMAGRQLTHAVLAFAEPVEGPVLLGAGRFQGLGLCMPLDGELA